MVLALFIPMCVTCSAVVKTTRKILISFLKISVQCFANHFKMSLPKVVHEQLLPYTKDSFAP